METVGKNVAFFSLYLLNLLGIRVAQCFKAENQTLFIVNSLIQVYIWDYFSPAANDFRCVMWILKI